MVREGQDGLIYRKITWADRETSESSLNLGGVFGGGRGNGRGGSSSYTLTKITIWSSQGNSLFRCNCHCWGQIRKAFFSKRYLGSKEDDKKLALCSLQESGELQDKNLCSTQDTKFSITLRKKQTKKSCVCCLVCLLLHRQHWTSVCQWELTA